MGTVAAGGDVTAVGFTGHRWHSIAGMWLTQYRGYDAGQGRWLSEDPLQAADGPNYYSYVGNKPLTRFDPDGRLAIAILPPLIVTVGLIMIIVDAIQWRNSNDDDPCERPEDRCWEECGHLLPSPSRDRQASEFTECYRKCMGRL